MLGVPTTLTAPSRISRSCGSASSSSAAIASDLLAQRAGRVQHRPVGHGRGPAPAGGDQRERRDVGVAVAHGDRLERHAELVGRHLGERRLVALAVRVLLGDE